MLFLLCSLIAGPPLYVCSLMQALGIWAQNYSRLPRSQSTVCYLI